MRQEKKKWQEPSIKVYPKSMILGKTVSAGEEELPPGSKTGS